MLKNFMKDEDGQGMVEYGLIIGLVSIVAIGVLVAIGGAIKGKFTEVNDALTVTAHT